MGAAYVALALLAGLGLGAVYFGGLWLTVRRLPTARNPGALAAASLFGRLAIVGGAFYGIAQARRWELLLAALAGMIVVRFVLIRKLRPGTSDHAP